MCVDSMPMQCYLYTLPSIPKHGSLLQACWRLHGTCIQEMICMCCVQVLTFRRAIRTGWVRQTSKGALDGFATKKKQQQTAAVS